MCDNSRAHELPACTLPMAVAKYSLPPPRVTRHVECRTAYSACDHAGPSDRRRRADRRDGRPKLLGANCRARARGAGEVALAQARAFDKRGKKTLLGGVPFGIKDIFDTVDMPTTYGSPIYVGCRPTNDASAATLPRAAGAILLGKTVTTEFANRQPGPTTNPRNPDFSPGGSSSGSAAAVADFMVPLAIGTQTGGSVIRPAAYCGVVGFKPSFGLFPPAGMRINTEALDTVGIMARLVGDIVLFRAAMMAIPYAAPAMPETALRLGMCRGPHWDAAQAEGRAALEAAVDRLAAAGAVITET